ncbi:ABC transporter substrate-binding protein [Geobacillus sp. 46C-IIa]|uniref:ABC transporter substrate-binding protein n=1 Tax=Geobacillus sp. 46C-IIa TaxID=1963025 RepID=UPI0009C18FEB|nr:ABC transporter substrate-binding protein [Geobacillus sp. 46C-IIa]OQP05266.1 ABC transporter substrate-binding protein [Geobacillus sp. 46C-IIa]QNU26591.1 ABC transporter substrate-binding protein [Geobacillus sp. 46C-IIa]
MKKTKGFWKRATGMMAMAALLMTAGCAQSNTSSGSGSDKSNGGDSGGSVKIGFILSQTGTFAPLSEGIVNGFQLYLEQHNGMLGGKKVEMKVEDDEANPQVALRKYRQLVHGEKADILVGPISSAVAYALRDEVEKDKKVLIDANAAGDDLSWSKKSDYVYRVSFSNWQNGSSTAKYLAEQVGKKAVILAPDYPAGKEVLRAFKAAFEAAGGKVLKEIYPKLNTNDFAPYLQQASAEKPDFIYAFFTGSDGVRFITQYKEFGLKGKIPLTGPLEFGDELLTQPTGQAAEGIIAGINYSPYLDNEQNKQFVEAYKEKYGKLPNIFAVEGYDSAAAIDQAINKAGSLNSQDLIKILKGISLDSPRGKITIDPATHNPIQNFYISKNVLKDGVIVPQIMETVENVKMPEASPF